MKLSGHYIEYILFAIVLSISRPIYGQGRVVINEYLPWPLNGCGVTSEFVELLNFGPGPMNIGCFILTDGDYSVTIPPNTILQPGEFYVIAGQDIIPFACANIDSAIHVDLNWNSCGCTNAPIPKTGDGFFTDGGFAKEQVVLLDANLKVVDAVIRDLPAEPSSVIKSSNTGGCVSKTFDLDTMSIHYEILGMSAGRGNSFARKIDGDCGWVKDPQQSGHATNNTPEATSDATYTFSVVKGMDCDSAHGIFDILIKVNSKSYQVFPMNYIVAYDADQNGIFDDSDSYSYGTDSTAPSIAIKGVPAGKYRITIATTNGCFLRTFETAILDCSSILTIELLYFKLKKQAQRFLTFEWFLEAAEKVQVVFLERSKDGISYEVASIPGRPNISGQKLFSEAVNRDERYTYYRLKLQDFQGFISYSPIIKTASNGLSLKTISPNPATDKLKIEIYSDEFCEFPYAVYSVSGAKIFEGKNYLLYGSNSIELDVSRLLPGMYQFYSKKNRSFSFLFIKR